MGPFWPLVSHQAPSAGESSAKRDLRGMGGQQRLQRDFAQIASCFFSHDFLPEQIMFCSCLLAPEMASLSPPFSGLQPVVPDLHEVIVLNPSIRSHGGAANSIFCIKEFFFYRLVLWLVRLVAWLLSRESSEPGPQRLGKAGSPWGDFPQAVLLYFSSSPFYFCLLNSTTWGILLLLLF